MGGVFLAAGTETVDTNDCMKTYTANIIGTLGASVFYTNVVFTNVVDLTVTNLTTNTFSLSLEFSRERLLSTVDHQWPRIRESWSSP